MEITFTIEGGENGALPNTCGVAQTHVNEPDAVDYANILARKGKSVYLLKPYKKIAPERQIEIKTEDI